MKIGEIYDEREEERAEAYHQGRKDALNELSEIMYRKAFEEESDMQKWDSGCWIRYKMFENAIEEVEE